MKKNPASRTTRTHAARKATTKANVRAAKASTPADTLTATNLPALGAIWPGQGGRFAGIAKGDAGQPDHLLVFATIDKKSDYAGALTLARELRANGHKDFDAPTLPEAALCYATCKEHFKKEWYWTGAQHADGPAWAWVQSFDFGSQDGDHKSGQYRVFAVRRVPIR